MPPIYQSSHATRANEQNGHGEPNLGSWSSSRVLPDPSVLPAPHGRGPTGWPLKLCECPCQEPMPWPRDGRGHGWATPREYNARRFINRDHEGAWKRHAKNTPSAFGERAPDTRMRPGIVHRTLESITECGRCGNQANLRNVGVGKACHCGHITFCREGDWARESLQSAMSGRS